MTEEEKKIVQRTYHEIALLADEKAKCFREESSHSIEADTLEDFAGELWLRINDFDIEAK